MAAATAAADGSAILAGVLHALIDLIPPSSLSSGPLTLGFYGIGFVLAIAVMILVSRSEARRKGADPALVTSAVIVVAIFALVGARLYHVLGEWQTYEDDPLRAILPPYAGLGLYGGIIGAAIGHLGLHARQGHPALTRAGHRGAGHAPRPGHRALGQLLQPGALRPTDRPALGHRHRLRPPHRPGPLRPDFRITTSPWRVRPASTRSSSTSRSSPSRAASWLCSSPAASAAACATETWPRSG